jgi:hypothetical protein
MVSVLLSYFGRKNGRNKQATICPFRCPESQQNEKMPAFMNV